MPDQQHSTVPAAHYDRVHAAWTLILGEEFHYGVFTPDDTSLENASARLTDMMRERAEIVPGDRVLDIGCGTGRQSCDLGEQVAGEVLGITTSATGVAAATELARSRGLTNVRFEQRDGMDNGLPDASFDVAWALESSHLMRDKNAVLGEGARVLAPGGRWVLCDIIRLREIPFTEVRARRREFATLRRVFGDAHMEPLELYADLLRGHGLDVVDLTDISLPTYPSFEGWRRNIEQHESTVVDLLGREDVDHFIEATRILESLWDEGTLGYGILAAVKSS